MPQRRFRAKKNTSQAGLLAAIIGIAVLLIGGAVLGGYLLLRKGGGGGGGAVANRPAPSGTGLQVGNMAPDIDGEDIDGVRFKLSDYRGKVVLLDFWGHW